MSMTLRLEGFAELEAALAEGAQYIWMMDDDNGPTAAAVRLLHEELARMADEVGLHRAAVLGFRPSQQEDIARGVPSRFAIQPRSSYFGFHVAQLPYKVWRRLPWGRPKGTPPRAIDLPFAPYGGMLAHRSLYQAIGVPLRELVLYADDTEYTRRITAKGGRLRLVTDALIMAIWRRGKPDSLLHHSDQDSQYTSEQFQRLMADHGITCSMSRSGNVWDNAAMESFFSSLKNERTARKVYRTSDDAKADVFDYIERFYNPRRRHSTLGYLSPVDYEEQAKLA